MILDFEHVKQKQHDDGTHWATYSDLFVALSFLFLLLYVVASLRTSSAIGTSAIEAKEARERAEQLEAQLAMMQRSAVGYLEEGATEKERKAYEAVMDRLKLLQDEQKSEQNKLAQQIAEHRQKETELNKYQETIKNLMLANLNAKNELKKRDEAIAETQRSRKETESKLKNVELALQKNDEKLQATLTHLETSVEKVEETKSKVKQVESTYRQKLADVSQTAEQKIQQANLTAEQKIQQANMTAEQKIQQANTTAEQKLQQIRQENQKRIAEITNASQQQLEQMTLQNQKQIAQLQSQLATQQTELKQKSQALQQATAEAQKRGDEINRLQGQFQAEKTRTEKLMGELRGQHEANLAKAKAEFEGKLGKFATDADARLNAEREYRGRVEAENAAFGRGIAELKGALAGSEGKLAALARERGELESKNRGLRDALGQAEADAKGLAQALADGKKKEAQIAEQMAKTMEDAKRREQAAADKAAQAVADAKDKAAKALAEAKAKEAAAADKAARALAEAKEKEAAAADKAARAIADAKQREAAIAAELAKAKANLARRGNISNKLADAFRNSGLNAQVDKKTGDLILNFGDEYFDTGRYFLKTGMVNVLNRAFPLYAKTLFDDPENAARISAIEIIGFASPTYQDRVVNPKSLSAVNQTAINYNLDLSYKRARSIFNHVFNPDKLVFAQQRAMLPLVKVTGRSFFTQDIEGTNAEKLDIENFCKTYDCQKSQNVVVRFTLID